MLGNDIRASFIEEFASKRTEIQRAQLRATLLEAEKWSKSEPLYYQMVAALGLNRHMPAQSYADFANYMVDLMIELRRGKSSFWRTAFSPAAVAHRCELH